MIVATTRLEIATDEGASLSDVTSDVNSFVRASGIANGLCVLSAPSSEACLTLSGELDEDVDDLLRLAWSHLAGRPGDAPDGGDEPGERPDRVDAEGAGYSPAGVLAECISLPVRDGAIGLGTWEAVVLLDARGPALRPIDVTVMGS
ncbi:MAG TPA: YjbQ family protein [Candidatus Krumholzibacteria bacterium]|nr:YjbQ family protein [Candidatus Krumholzibacteria bacterium]